MNRKILWVAVSSLIVMSLVIAACGPAAAPSTPTTPAAPITPAAPATPVTPVAPTPEKPKQEAAKPAAETPKYGGTLTLAQAGDQTNFDPSRVVTSAIINLTHQEFWAGDWARGIAGGYGTKETDWGAGNNDIYNLKMGHIAESWNWSVDTARDHGTIVYQIRRGVHFALNPASEASRLVNGREVTTDDAFYTMKRATTDLLAYVYRSNVELRNIDVTKTGPREITVKVPTATLISAISRMGDTMFVSPPELVTKYGDLQNWRNSVGTGPFMLTDYVPGSVAVMVRNPNFWMKDPVEPGKGNQLPYLNSVRVLIIPDASTRTAALRTGKVDRMTGMTQEDAASLQKTTPALLWSEAPSNQGRGTPAYIRVDKAPYNDVRVRQAMMLAIDFQSILRDYRGGHGQIMTWPYSYIREYGDLVFSGPDDPELPASVKELYSYKPEKAKQLLKEAGYPNGFKTSIVITSSEVDYWSIIKDMWAKVGIDFKLDVKESAVKTNILNSRTHEAMITDTSGPVAAFYFARRLQGEEGNSSMINDPVINEGVAKVRTAAITDLKQAMRIYKDLLKNYVLERAYAIPDVIGSVYSFWWPWLKNYSGEWTVGYDDPIWPQYIWYDEAMKKSMGY